jgi:hypothetical protein
MSTVLVLFQRLEWRCRESNPGPPASHKGFSVRSPLCLYSDPPVTRTSRCDDPSRCVLSRPTPRPDRTVCPLTDAGHRSGDNSGPTRAAPAYAARARSLWVTPSKPAGTLGSGRSERRRRATMRGLLLRMALTYLRRMVNELIVAFLDTLPLDQCPKSKPFTPWSPFHWTVACE